MCLLKPSKLLNGILFLLELGTMLFFIPLLIYLAEFSFGLPIVGFLVGILGIIHYYIFRWYNDGGSLVYFGLSIVVASVGTGLTMFLDLFKTLFFPAGYLFECSRLFLPKIIPGDNAIYYYYVFLTGIVYVSLARILVVKLCSLLGYENCVLKRFFGLGR